MRINHIILFLFIAPFLRGQTTTLLLKDSVNIAAWTNDVGIYATLYTGKEHAKYPMAYENSPFYLTKDPLDASLSYDGVYYSQVRLRWDTYTDEVIVLTPDGRYNIILVPGRFEKAGLESGQLSYLYADKISGIKASGYYLELYDNQYKIWYKLTTVLEPKMTGQLVNYSFISRDSYYIQKGNMLFQVRNMSGILRVFADKKKELRQFAKKNSLDFKTNTKGVLMMMVNEYERLTQTNK